MNCLDSKIYLKVVGITQQQSFLATLAASAFIIVCHPFQSFSLKQLNQMEKFLANMLLLNIHM
jgi:hypothetical protein